MPEPGKVEVKERGRIKIKADKIEVETESDTRGVMFCLIIAEKLLQGFKEDDRGKMYYKSQLGEKK